METGSLLKDATSFHNLPPEITVDIFSRLPVKTLIRSTSVNKSWYSVITNPSFISAQIRRSISYFEEAAVFIVPCNISPQNPCTLFSVETFSAIKTFEIPFSTKSGNVELSGSVNGLYCLTDASDSRRCRDLYLWNPTIRRYKTLVSSCFPSSDSTKTNCIVGFGFHESTDDYRVVRVHYYKDDESNYFGMVAPKVEIFSLKRNTWRKIRNPVVPGLVQQNQRTGTYVNGSVYWLPSDDSSEYSEELWILSFDMNNEVFGKVKLPNNVGNCLGKSANICLMELDGSVSVFLFYRDFDTLFERGILSQPCCIWVMRHEDGAWIRRLRVEIKNVIIGSPLKITKSGTLIMEILPQEQPNFIGSINLKNLTGRYLGFESLDGHSSVDTSFIESLVLLDRGNVLLKHAK